MRLLVASWAIVASEVRLGRRLMEPSWGRFGASMGSSWGGSEVSGGLPGVILLAQGLERDMPY